MRKNGKYPVKFKQNNQRCLLSSTFGEIHMQLQLRQPSCDGENTS